MSANNHSAPTLLTYQDILATVQDDFDAMDKHVFGSLNSKVKLVMNVSQHVINAGGKRMRPLITLLCSRMLVDERHEPALHLAAITEMLHTATLVHDDVIDESGLRRGKPTANATWNNPIAVLVGDYLIARSFNLLVDFRDFRLLEIFSDGTCDIAEGEVLQLQHQHNPDATEHDYMNIVDGKTSRLFMMATQGAALLHNKDEYLESLSAFGQHFGNAFQIIDDVLDYSGDPEIMGKNLGDDLAEGKPTLPTIKALELLKESNEEHYQLLRVAVKTGRTLDYLTELTPEQASAMKTIQQDSQDNSSDNNGNGNSTDNITDNSNDDNDAIANATTQEIIEMVKNSGALDYCKKRAFKESELALQALEQLPDNIYREALYQLTNLAIARLN